jgi:hypothetical protein
MSSGVSRVFSQSSKRIEQLAPELEKIISPSASIQELAEGFGGPWDQPKDRSGGKCSKPLSGPRDS